MDDPVAKLILETLEMNKQAIVFVSTKNSAESQAEKLSKTTKLTSPELTDLSDRIRKVIKATSQCERLSRCVKKGIAFHHAGLHSKQKEMIENAFRHGLVKVICCTPTLAMGVSLPAFRAIIRDVRRFSENGSNYISTLEHRQMQGRAGRPEWDTHGEAITLASTESEKDMIVEKYHNGEPEPILSKLAVEPVLRTYILSLVASRIVSSRKEIMAFFGKTLWAHQYKNMGELEDIIDRMLLMLMQFDFLKIEDDKYRATFLGKRVAELYIDPMSARIMILGLEKSKTVQPKSIPISQMLCNCLEMRPLLTVKQKEYETVMNHVAKWENLFLIPQPSMFEPEWEDWLNALKTGLLFEDWINEADDEQIMETYNSRPGETRAKLEKADWLLYCLCEIARIIEIPQTEFRKLRMRIKYGVKEELLPLVKMKQVGRVRARKLFNAGIKTPAEVMKADDNQLNLLLGPGVAKKIKDAIED